MNNEADKQTFKLKKKRKKRNKEKESNSSRDSLELTIKTFQNNNKIIEKETEEGEKIKFFFNELPSTKKNINLISDRKQQKLNIKSQKEKEEVDFREILLNYVNQTGRTNENKSHKKERNSVIYTKPNTVLTLNGDKETNKKELSNQISESNSEYNSLSDSNSDKKTEKMEELHKKINEDINKKNEKKNNNKNIKENIKKNTESKKKSIKSNEKKELKSSEKNIKKSEIKSKKMKNEVILLSDKKVENTERNNESVINSNYNGCLNSNKRTSNTTGATTCNTQNTQNSSFKSLQVNLKKYNYDYLNSIDLSLQKKIIMHSKINSCKKIINREEKDNIGIKNDGTNLFEKIKNINISLEVEKSYTNCFKQIINLQNQKNNYKKIDYKDINNSEKNIERKNIKNNKYYKRYFFYPDEYYIDKNSNLHYKYHVSKIFEKLRKKC